MRLIIFLLAFNSYAQDLTKLSRGERERLYKGEFVMLTHEVDNAPWPRLEIFKIVESDPQSIAAFFADFEAQPEYVPNLLKAKIVKEDNPLDVHVDYEMHLPWPLSNAKYIHGHHLSGNSNDRFKVAWYLVSSSVTEELRGHAEFIGYGSNKTLWHYEAFVRPKSALAGLFEGTMKSDTIKTLEATHNHFKLWQQSNPTRLRHSIDLWQRRFKISTK